MSPREISGLLRIALYLVLAAFVVWYGERLWRGFVGYVQAPAQLDSALGANAAFKAAAEASNKGIDADQKAGEKRKAQAALAVKEAGKADFNRAQGIQVKPAAGSTPLERAANRINAEFGR